MTTGCGQGLRGKFDDVSRDLLLCANRSGSRTEFLREASCLMLRFTGADSLDFWLEDGELRYHWRAGVQPRSAFRLTNLPTRAGSGQGSSPLRDGESPTRTLLEQILPLIDGSEQLVTSGRRTAGGSLWVRELDTGNSGDDEPGSDAPSDSGTAHRHCQSVVVVPFEIDGRNEGVLRLGSAKPGFFTQSRVESYEGLVQLLGVAMGNRRARRALTERVKELTCMYGIAHIAAASNRSLDDTLQEIVELLPPAWQYPDITTARITLDEHTFRSSGFEVGPHHLSADILIKGAPRGRVEVFYTDQGRDLDEAPLLKGAPFLAEEHHLIQGVARELAFIIGRKHTEEEKIQLQEQIRRADRLATIGQLAAGVAHELNEPLGNILGFAQLVNKSPELADPARRDIDKIVTATLHAREIIKKLMFFSRQTPSRKTDMNLNETVAEVTSLFESRCAKTGITVVHKLAPNLPVVRGDPAQLQQVLVNLVVNAIQAMPDGGRLHIATVARDDAVCLILEDTGIGIPAEDLESIFAPFFTTKDVGQGTGLGLSVVHGIVSSHGGSVQATSTVGSGTCFEVQLPTKERTTAEGGSDGE